SLGNYIGVSEPPGEVYGKTMSLPDAMTERYLRLVSGLGPAEIEAALALGPRDAKAALARRLAERLHGPEAAAEAEAEFERRFRQRQLPDVLPEGPVGAGADLVGALVELGWYASRSAARRVVEQNGVRVNGERAGLDQPLRDGDVLQAGK